MVGRYFVARAFSGDSKSYAETVIRSTIQAFKDRLPELDWLDPSSRAAAEEKADAVSVNIGWATSPNVTDPRALAAYYASVRPEKGKFFETVSAGRTMEERRKWFSIAKKRDPGVWEMDPITVNAYYQPQQNGMFFPAGVLQAPYFSKDYPEYLGFGSMASLAGHELTVSRVFALQAPGADVYARSTPLTRPGDSLTRLVNLRTGGQMIQSLATTSSRTVSSTSTPATT